MMFALLVPDEVHHELKRTSWLLLYECLTECKQFHNAGNCWCLRISSPKLQLLSCSRQLCGFAVGVMLLDILAPDKLHHRMLLCDGVSRCYRLTI